MPDDVKLKPCPFCGGEARQPFISDAVECANRDCRGYAVTRQAWNTRPDPSEEDVERVARAIERSLDLSDELCRDLRADGEFREAARAAINALKGERK